MAQEAQLAKQYGGLMIWEMMGDASAPHSLLKVIEQTLQAPTPTANCPCNHEAQAANH
jgi:hypothetical protein